jgi:hypothetical protein
LAWRRPDRRSQQSISYQIAPTLTTAPPTAPPAGRPREPGDGGPAPKLARGFQLAREDSRPGRRFIGYNGTERFPMGQETEAIGLGALAVALAEMRPSSPHTA